VTPQRVVNALHALAKSAAGKLLGPDSLG